MPAADRTTLPKAPTGIVGFDDITLGGLPAGRPSLVCGAAGSGKTLFAATFLVNGATQFDEPGVFMSFEERAEDLAANVASLGYDLDGLIASGKLAVDHVRVERSEIEENGEYDLEGLFIRLAYAVETVGAKRVVLDTIETLFAGLTDQSLLRAELRRLFGWIKERGLTAIITGERGDGQFTRQGLEEYVSDCVVLLDNRVQDQVTTRRLRVVKYRGSAHGTNEYPFLIDDEGISVLPVTSAGLVHGVSDQVVSSGVPGIDAMLGRGGYFRGSSVLVTGNSGSGKTTIGALFADAACARGERCMVFMFEESAEQLCRNAASVGLDLQRHVKAGLLRFEAARPTLFGLEMHLARMHRDLVEFDPVAVVIDPISALRGPATEVHATLLRMVDLLKSRDITGVFTSLRDDGSMLVIADQGLSSLMDVWVKLANVEFGGEINRSLYVMKARGMSHSNQLREYVIGEEGIRLIDPYITADGVLTGTARLARTAHDEAEAVQRTQETERLHRDFLRRREAMDHEIVAMRQAMDSEENEIHRRMQNEATRDATSETSRLDLVSRRSAAK